MDQTRATARHYPLLAHPNVHLHGPVNDAMYDSFRQQLVNAPSDGTLVFSITTLGGDPEVARAMGDDVRLLGEYTGRETLFLGKVAVYSAGATFMAAFPNDKRFLTRGTRLLVHERQMSATVDLNGPLRMQVANLKAKLHEIEQSIAIEEEGFRALIKGSSVDYDDLLEKAPNNLYIDCQEALAMGLILDVI
ncbi:MAG TPA: ATP-dependent Clp protease proteolytic subunit [Sphingomonas sp.]|nr:ATP-dependent Clp protease proteolytic subunit [Sphingomonas sp.]